MTEWRTADTMKEDAPKFGEHFLVYHLGGEPVGEVGLLPGSIGLARYVPDDQSGWKLETNWQFRGPPTHWMPLPESPHQ